MLAICIETEFSECEELSCDANPHQSRAMRTPSRAPSSALTPGGETERSSAVLHFPFPTRLSFRLHGPFIYIPDDEMTE